MPSNAKIEVVIVLTQSNAWAAAIVAAALDVPVEEVVSSCLKGSTNLKSAT